MHSPKTGTGITSSTAKARSFCPLAPAEPYDFYMPDNGEIRTALAPRNNPILTIRRGSSILIHTSEGTIHADQTEDGFTNHPERNLHDLTGRSMIRSKARRSRRRMIPRACAFPHRNSPRFRAWNGATALYPLYAALVQATYPDSTQLRGHRRAAGCAHYFVPRQTARTGD